METEQDKNSQTESPQVWELMAQRIYRQCTFVLIPAAIISAFLSDWRFPLSILVGGLIGVGNLKGIILTVNAMLGVKMARAKMMALSMFKILMIFSVLLILIILKAINPYGLLIGFTVVIIIIIKEGLRASKKRL
jgi:hypothetical protein